MLNFSKCANRDVGLAIRHWRELDATSFVFSGGARMDCYNLMLSYFCFGFRYKDYLPPRLARLDPRMFCKVIIEVPVVLAFCSLASSLTSIITLFFYRRCFTPLVWMIKITSLVFPRSFSGLARLV